MKLLAADLQDCILRFVDGTYFEVGFRACKRV